MIYVEMLELMLSAKVIQSLSHDDDASLSEKST